MDLEQQLNKILSDPQSMNTIMQIAQSLGAPPGESTAESEAAPPPDLMHSGRILQLLQSVQSAQQRDPQQQALLDALRPYVTPEHCQRLERAMQMAQLSKLAGLTLQDMDQI